jgi:acyl-CoA ligase (AMP-forming) (exosortase A-associated)
MGGLVHHLLSNSVRAFPERTALVCAKRTLSYREMGACVDGFASQLLAAGIGRGERVAVYAEKRFEVVASMFASAQAGAVFVPVNPTLKAEQVSHILNDCNVRILVTTPDRLAAMREVLPTCPDLQRIFAIGGEHGEEGRLPVLPWSEAAAPNATAPHRVIDGDMAAILYTSGSTGKPKGVVLTHRNIVAGAESVAEYLELTPEDRTLCVPPLSFDYGMNQVMTAFLTGATAVLFNLLFAKDVVSAVVKHRITGLPCVAPLWIQVAELDWPESVQEHLRYFTNTGGAMPRETLARLRKALPTTAPYLMYGLTEAFRSTYLPPAQADRRPDSIGKAIPNAEILVVRPDGSTCDPNEPGELVHRGVHVSLGYWNDAEKTAERFKAAPGQPSGLVNPELAVWSGDTVRTDDEGFIYFIGRRDEMIKTSGYRVSPTEVEEVLYATGLVGEAAAFGVKHPKLGDAIVVVATAADGAGDVEKALRAECQKRLPVYMVPAHIEIVAEALPRNPNGKIDRKALASARAGLFGA